MKTVSPKVGMPIQYFDYDGTGPVAAVIVEVYRENADSVDIVYWRTMHLRGALIKAEWDMASSVPRRGPDSQAHAYGWQPVPDDSDVSEDTT